MQKILGSLHQKNIDTALDESRSLLFKRLDHCLKADMSEGRQLGGWTKRSSDKARLVLSRELVRHFASELRCLEIDLPHLIAQVEFAQNNGASAKGIGFYNVAAHPEKIRVDIANNVRTAQDQNLAAVFFAPVIIQSRVSLLDIGAHGAVVDNNALFHCL